MNVEVAAQWCRDVDNSAVLTATTPVTNTDKPVVALVGSYNAGKTSLIRRLLQERNMPCPDVLAVASDPTTFEPVDVDGGFVVLRDTPGLGSGKELHNRRAVESAVQADILVLVMTPQLLSGADADAWDLLTGAAWGRGESIDLAPGVLLVINRFDMAGADPAEELDAYLALAERKKSELRASLRSRGILGELPIVVTAGNPYGLATDGDDFAHEPWDGLPQLLDTLELLIKQLPELRVARDVRVRGRVLMQRHAGLVAALAGLETAEAQSALRHQDALIHRRELARIWQRAEVEREELLREAIGLDAMAAAAPDRASLLRDRIERALDAWSQALEDRLRTYAQAAPEGQILDGAPVSAPTTMPLLDPHEAPGDVLTDALKAVRDNASQVKTTAKAFHDLGAAFPSLAKLTKYVSAEVLDAAVSAASLWLDVSGAEDRAARRAAVEQRDHYTSLATQQSEAAIVDLRAWTRTYDQALGSLCQQIADELEGLTTAIQTSREGLEGVGALLRSIPA